jgi:hypothetical protein
MKSCGEREQRHKLQSSLKKPDYRRLQKDPTIKEQQKEI